MVARRVAHSECSTAVPRAAKRAASKVAPSVAAKATKKVAQWAVKSAGPRADHSADCWAASSELNLAAPLVGHSAAWSVLKMAAN